MKNFIKNALLVVLVVLLASTFLDNKVSSLSSSLENDIIIVDSGIALPDNDDMLEQETIINSNIFSKLGSFVSNIFSKIAEFISKIIGMVFMKIIM